MLKNDGWPATSQTNIPPPKCRTETFQLPRTQQHSIISGDRGGTVLSAAAYMVGFSLSSARELNPRSLFFMHYIYLTLAVIIYNVISVDDNLQAVEVAKGTEYERTRTNKNTFPGLPGILSIWNYTPLRRNLSCIK